MSAISEDIYASAIGNMDLIAGSLFERRLRYNLSRWNQKLTGGLNPKEQVARGRMKFLRDIAFWIRALTVLTIVFGVNLVIEYGVLTSVFPLLHNLQLRSHRILCGMLPRPANPKWPRIVAIDDELHEKLKEPTDRKYLATLIRNAAQGEAALIVLDFY